MATLASPHASTVESIQQARARRAAALRSALAPAGVDALLISRPCDILYLTGFCGHDSVLLVSGSAAALLSDNRYDTQLNPVRQEGLAEVVIGVRHRLPDSLPDLVRRHSIRHLGVQSEHLTVAWKQNLEKVLSNVTVKPTSGLVERLRMRKDAGEIAAMEHAIAINEQALAATLPQIEPGLRECEILAILDYEMKRRGAFAAGFRQIIAVGPNGALPHYETADEKVRANSSLLIDWGTTAEGYNADMTRTFGVESMPPKVEEIYRIVLDAQMAAIDAIRPGRTCAEIDAVARDFITKAGYGQYFGHGLGHGIGLEVHEAPFFNNLQTDVILEPGITMTVEPGIYLPGVGGVRIEDNIVVTDTGCRVLTGFPKDPRSAILTPGVAAASN